MRSYSQKTKQLSILRCPKWVGRFVHIAPRGSLDFTQTRNIEQVEIDQSMQCAEERKDVGICDADSK